MHCYNIYCIGLQTLTVRVGKLTGGWNAEVYYTVLHIINTFVCVYKASCLWSWCLYNFVHLYCVHLLYHIPYVRPNTSPDRSFNSNVGEGDITSFPPTGVVYTIRPCNFISPAALKLLLPWSLSYPVQAHCTFRLLRRSTWSDCIHSIHMYIMQLIV